MWVRKRLSPLHSSCVSLSGGDHLNLGNVSMHLRSRRYPCLRFDVKTLHPCPACSPLLAQAEREEEEEEGEEDGSLIEIAEEADLIQADRMIEEEEVVRPRRRKKEENGAVQELAKVLLAMRLDNYGPGTAAGQEQAAGEWEVTHFLTALESPNRVGKGNSVITARGLWVKLSRNRPETICPDLIFTFFCCTTFTSSS